MAQPPDPFEFLKNLWGPMGLPLAGLMAPTLDSKEIERRIAELKSVENWLNMNLNVLRMTLQGLEMQRSGLDAMQGTADEDKTAEESAVPGAATSAKTPTPKPGRKDSPQKK